MSAERTDIELQRFQLLFEHSTIGIVIIKMSGEIEMANRFAQQQFGYTEAELVGQKVEKLVPSEFAEKHVQHRTKYSQHPVSRPMGIGMDLFGVKKDGTRFPVEISLSHYTANGEGYVIAFVNDITLRKQNEEAIMKQKEELEENAGRINQLNAELEKRVEERTLVLRETLQQLEHSRKELSEALAKEKELSDLKSRFVSIASHEFRTPLATILSSASLIEKYQKTEEAEKRLKHIDRIKENVRNLNDILEDFLSLDKLEEGIFQPKYEDIDVSVLIEELISDLKEVKRSGQSINYQLNGPKRFKTDKAFLKNILINLLSNAIKFSDEDGNIDIVQTMEKNRLRISIKDNGMGISSEDQQHLFDRFFRAKNATNIKGTGLGLHIVSKYVELLKGNLNFKSELNKGSEFIINIPDASSKS